MVATFRSVSGGIIRGIYMTNAFAVCRARIGDEATCTVTARRNLVEPSQAGSDHSALPHELQTNSFQYV
jgi:hypothetical protein